MKKKNEFTLQTRLIDLVDKKYHPELKTMIEELRPITLINEKEEWWKVRRLDFVHPKSMTNYLPIARFIMVSARNGNKGLKCSANMFFRYLTSSEHSNLRIKRESIKSLIYSMIKFSEQNKNGIF